MIFNIKKTLLGKLLINNSKQIFTNLDKISKYHEITKNNNWICEITYKYKNDYNKNIIISNIFLHNNKLNLSYEELLYKDMNNNKLLNNDFHILLKNKKEINITKIPNIFYNIFNKDKQIIDLYIYKKM
jgi:hypothetical protein